MRNQDRVLRVLLADLIHLLADLIHLLAIAAGTVVIHRRLAENHELIHMP